VGVDPDVVRRLSDLAGLADLVGPWTDGDLDALRALKAALDAGIPDDALVQVLRVYGDALARMAEAEIRLFHMHVHQRLRREGLSGRELMAATDAAGVPLRELVEPTVLYVHRKAWDRAQREDLVTHLAEDAGLWPTIDATGRVPAAVVFVDLSGFTSLTAVMGDLAAADVVERFSVIVRQVVGRSPGRLVKQIGDGSLLLFPDAASAVSCGAALEQRVSREPQFQVLATRPVVEHAGALDGIDFVPVGHRRLKDCPKRPSCSPWSRLCGRMSASWSTLSVAWS
jgi:adenylate cyclase